MQNSILFVIQIFISLEATKVIESFFNHGNDENKGKWSHVSEQEADLEEGDELTDGHQEEEHVEEELEFVVENLWDESQNVVLLIIHSVCHEVRRNSASIHA